MLQRRAGSGKGCLEVGDRLAGLDDDVPEDDRAVLAARQLARDEQQIAAAPDLGERRALGGEIFGGHVFPFSPVDRSAMRRVPPRPWRRSSPRTEARRVGKECVSTYSSRVSQDN